MLAQVEESISIKEKEFESYILTNNICPIAKIPFSSDCVAKIKSEIF